MSDVASLILPILGVITSISITFSSCPSILRLSKSFHFPTAGLSASVAYSSASLPVNGLAWFFYGLFQKDVFVALPNLASICMGLGYCLVVFASRETDKELGLSIVRQRMILIVCGGLCAVLTVALIAFLAPLPDSFPPSFLLGLACNTLLALFYMSPLASLWTILKTRDTSSIQVFLSMTCLMNGLLWGFYGIVKQDAWMSAPNLFGAVVNFLPLLMKIIIRKRQISPGTSQELLGSPLA